MNELAKAMQESKDHHEEEYTSFLIYGGFGSGKTHSLSTARLPIYIFSFDAGGAQLPCIKKLVDAGLAVVDYSVANDVPEKPFAYRRLSERLKALHKEGAWEKFGTIAVDSLTTLADSIMWHVRPGGQPQIQDYNTLELELRKLINTGNALPCDFILTAHIDINRDEVSGAIITSVMVPGRVTKEKIPQQFSEVYVAEPTAATKTEDIVYKFATRPRGKLKARTRIGSGIFDEYVPMDFMALRKLAGREVEHKPPLTAS